MENEDQSNVPPSSPILQPSNSVSQSKNWSKTLLPVMLGFVLVAGGVFAGIQIGKNQINRENNIPTSFQECDRRAPKKEDFSPDEYIFPFCDYFVEENNSIYQQCISSGGVKTENICMLCPDCGCTPAGCKLTYIDPSFILPTNINECKKVFTHSGGGSIYENGGKEDCAIIIPKRGVYNIETGESLLKACFSQNGKAFGENGSCELKFYN